MKTPVQELAQFTFADITAIYQRDTASGRVQLMIVPKAGKIPRHRDVLEDPALHDPKPAWELDSLVQVRLADDPCVTAFGNGRTMRNSEATLGLRFVRQRRTKNRVVTVLKNARGFRCEHVLEWNKGEQALRMTTKFINTSRQPLTVELLSSFSLGGITPFARDEAPVAPASRAELLGGRRTNRVRAARTTPP